uniref:Trypsin inhibitor 2c n=1 Tax=Fagopyrum esculentum TaxID=3617 RepID=ITR2C_FAGES|nr:RecName: Full=Trypsin inhibitor 2c; AltName: Full=BWI-2c [Fagopyrum esculentum]2LQX_A Chain A, Trypsin inhibitor BWI-2c [Fagopyrum esculentum]
SEKPQQELEECQNVCRMKRWSTEMVHRCEKKCEEKFERQQR